jgi:hypothetical protein
MHQLTWTLTLLLVAACASAGTNATRAHVTLDQTVHFRGAGGAMVEVPAGEYGLADGGGTTLTLVPGDGDPIPLEAARMEHEFEPSRADGKVLPGLLGGQQHVCLLLPNGQALETVGTLDGSSIDGAMSRRPLHVGSAESVRGLTRTDIPDGSETRERGLFDSLGGMLVDMFGGPQTVYGSVITPKQFGVVNGQLEPLEWDPLGNVDIAFEYPDLEFNLGFISLTEEDLPQYPGFTTYVRGHFTVELETQAPIWFVFSKEGYETIRIPFDDAMLSNPYTSDDTVHTWPPIQMFPEDQQALSPGVSADYFRPNLVIEDASFDGLGRMYVTLKNDSPYDFPPLLSDGQVNTHVPLATVYLYPGVDQQRLDHRLTPAEFTLTSGDVDWATLRLAGGVSEPVLVNIPYEYTYTGWRGNTTTSVGYWFRWAPNTTAFVLVDPLRQVDEGMLTTDNEARIVYSDPRVRQDTIIYADPRTRPDHYRTITTPREVR